MPSTIDPNDPRFVKEDIRVTRQYKTVLLNEMSNSMTVLRTKQKHAETSHKQITTDMLAIYDQEVAAEDDAATQRDRFIAAAPAAFAGDEDAKRDAMAALTASNQASKLGTQHRRVVEDMRNKLGAIEHGFITVCNDYNDVMYNVLHTLIRGVHVHTGEDLVREVDGRLGSTVWASIVAPAAEAGVGGAETEDDGAQDADTTQSASASADDGKGKGKAKGKGKGKGKGNATAATNTAESSKAGNAKRKKVHWFMGKQGKKGGSE